jgi:hypothetical protein
MQRLFSTASSVIVADVTIKSLEGLDSQEVHVFNNALSSIKYYIYMLHLSDVLTIVRLMQLFPSHIPDLSFGSPLIISGRYNGTFPELVKVTGTFADMTSFVVDLKVKREKDMKLTNVISNP